MVILKGFYTTHIDLKEYSRRVLGPSQLRTQTAHYNRN